jgi:hypothetical protein
VAWVLLFKMHDATRPEQRGLTVSVRRGARPFGIRNQRLWRQRHSFSWGTSIDDVVRRLIESRRLSSELVVSTRAIIEDECPWFKMTIGIQ